MLNLAALQRFMPLMALANKKAHELTDDDLSSLSTTLAGEGEASNALLGALKVLREKEPLAAAAEILGSPTAMKIFESVKERIIQAGESDNSAFIKCPHCGQLSEHELQ